MKEASGYGNIRIIVCITRLRLQGRSSVLKPCSHGRRGCPFWVRMPSEASPEVCRFHLWGTHGGPPPRHTRRQKSRTARTCRTDSSCQKHEATTSISTSAPESETAKHRAESYCSWSCSHQQQVADSGAACNILHYAGFHCPSPSASVPITEALLRCASVRDSI